MTAPDTLYSMPIKAAVAAYRAGDVAACVTHYEDAILRYPELAAGIQATLDVMRRVLRHGKSGLQAGVAPGQALSRSDSPMASALRSLGIERIYVINLDRRPDRMWRVLREMNAHGLKVNRVPAVDARSSIPARDLMEKFRRRDPRMQASSASHVSVQHVEQWKETLPPGVFGYLLSQAAVLQDASRNGYRRIAVFDDDVFFTSDAPARLRDATEHLPVDWKILLLGASEYADRSSEDFVQARVPGCTDLYHPIAGTTCGSFAVVYDQSVYDEVLLAIDEAEAPYDNFALGTSYARHRRQCFVIDPAVCVPDVSESNIRDRSRAQQSHSLRMRWEFARYGVFTAPMSMAVLVQDPKALVDVELLEHRLPGNGVLNIYYLSPGGIRAATPEEGSGGPNAGMLPIALARGEALRQLAIESCVPPADIVMLWPRHWPLDSLAAQVVFVRALERANSGAGLEGEVDGIAYCLDTGMASW